MLCGVLLLYRLLVFLKITFSSSLLSWYVFVWESSFIWLLQWSCDVSRAVNGVAQRWCIRHTFHGFQVNQTRSICCCNLFWWPPIVTRRRSRLMRGIRLAQMHSFRNPEADAIVLAILYVLTCMSSCVFNPTRACVVDCEDVTRANMSLLHLLRQPVSLVHSGF